jgi:rod shape-determining protein MreD
LSTHRHQGGGTIALSVVVALTLSILPLPEWALPYRPDWVTLVLIYWCLALPARVGVGVAWVVGLLLDVLSGSLLGQHALGLAVVAFLALRFHQQIRVFPLIQQALVILLLLGVKQLLLLWVNGILGHPGPTWLYWAPSLTGMMLWPWIYVILRDLRRRFHVT